MVNGHEEGDAGPSTMDGNRLNGGCADQLVDLFDSGNWVVNDCSLFLISHLRIRLSRLIGLIELAHNVLKSSVVPQMRYSNSLT